MSIRVNPLGPAAAEIFGLDCARSFTDRAFQVVESAFLDYPVLIFRDQLLSATDVARFGRRFGPLEGYGTPATTAGSKAETPKRELAALRQIDGRETPDLLLYVSPSDPDVLMMSNEIRSDLNAIGIVDNAETWHSDASHRAQPCKAVALYATCNPSAGGDTEFCDMRAVYDALAADLKAELAGRTAIHHWSKSKNPQFAGTLDAAAYEEGERIARLVPEMRQPVVRTHPQTGRLSLYASPRFALRIDDVSQERSDRLLAEIFALAEEPRFHYRHQWRDNDLVIWDNRCLNHRVRFFPTQDIRRRLRVSIVGDRPFYLPAASAHPDDVARADWCEARRRHSGRAQIDGTHDLIVAA